MTSKQRANLRSMAMNIDAIYQIGKSGISDAMIEGISAALEKRELVKLTVLRNCGQKADKLIDILAEKLKAEPVTAVGNKIVLYRRSQAENINHIEF